MAKYWLKSFGRGHDQVPDVWQEWEKGLFLQNITFAQSWRFMVGDPVAYYAAGWQRVVAIGRIVGEALPSPTPIWDQMAPVELEWHRRSTSGIPLDSFDPLGRLRTAVMRRSHLRLKEAEAEALHRAAGLAAPSRAVNWP